MKAMKRFEFSRENYFKRVRIWLSTYVGTGSGLATRVGSAIEKNCSGDFNDNIINVVLVLRGCVGNLEVRINIVF